jgi:hypothetical protein
MDSHLRIGILAVIFIFGGTLPFAGVERDPADLASKTTSDPADATYIIDDQKVHLRNGRFEGAAVSGSATRSTIQMFSEPVFGDLDGDGDEDAALYLVVDPGGSGTFYYVAAAHQIDGGYDGTSAVYLGDRLKPHNLKIHNGVVVAKYAQRLSGESMATPPSVDKSAYLILTAGNLVLLPALGEKETVIEGWVTIGHEVRTIQPCSGDTELWLSGRSPVLETIKAAYSETLPPSAGPYTPVFMVLAGRLSEPPAQGFGADDSGALIATRLLQVWSKGNCKSDVIVVDYPLPGAAVSSPLKIRGRARGMWFFEGDFPVILVDASGTVIARGFCSAKSDWMTDQFVPFEGMVEFLRTGAGDRGTLILKKDNASDIPEFDDALQIPVSIR